MRVNVHRPRALRGERDVGSHLVLLGIEERQLELLAVISGRQSSNLIHKPGANDLPNNNFLFRSWWWKLGDGFRELHLLYIGVCACVLAVVNIFDGDLRRLLLFFGFLRALFYNSVKLISKLMYFLHVLGMKKVILAELCAGLLAAFLELIRTNSFQHS